MSAMASAVSESVGENYLKMEKSALNLFALRDSFFHQVTKLIKTRPENVCNEPDCSCKTVTACPPGCPCKEESSSYRALSIIINGIGILLAVLATYMIISTDSKLYLVFWICYSILRRMMAKSRKHLKAD